MRLGPKQVQTEIDRFFARSMNVEPRALDALAIATKSGRHPPGHLHFWSALRLSLPAIQRLYQAVGYESAGSALAPYVDWVVPYEPHSANRAFTTAQWQRVLRRPFCRMGPISRPDLDELTPAAAEMKAAGQITAIGLAKSMVDSGTSRKSDHKARVNISLRVLAEGSGVKDAPYWTSRPYSDFAVRAKILLEGLHQIDDDLGERQFLLYHDGSRIRVAPFGAFDVFRLDDAGTRGRSRANVIQSPSTSLFAPSAIEGLEELVNSSAAEASFQRFFEEYPEFLTALGPYAAVHPQLVLRREDGTGEIPDFFLERLDSDFCDIVDLKRASVELVRRQPRRSRFRASVMEAAAQLQTYRDYFDDGTHRRLFNDRYGLNAYRPRVVIVMGRRRSFEDELERIRLESALPGWLQLKTYDDVLASARKWHMWSRDAAG